MYVGLDIQQFGSLHFGTLPLTANRKVVLAASINFTRLLESIRSGSLSSSGLDKLLCAAAIVSH